MSQVLLDAMSVTLKTKTKNLKQLSIEEFILFVEQCQREIVQTFALTQVQVRRMNPQTLHDLYHAMKHGDGGQFVFRHGEQDFSPVNAPFDEMSKKIIMMQAKHNENDPITLNSSVEFIGTLLTLAYLKEKASYRIQVDSSSNRRAKQPAEMLAKTFEIPLLLSPSWECINYPADSALDSTQLDMKGNLEWNRQKVDAVIGIGTFDRITDEIKTVLTAEIAAKTIQVIITHTQQLDEFYAKASGLPASGRLSHYGFVFRNRAYVLRYEDGFYNKEILTLKYELPRFSQLSSQGVFANSSIIPDEEARKLKLK